MKIYDTYDSGLSQIIPPKCHKSFRRLSDYIRDWSYFEYLCGNEYFIQKLYSQISGYYEALCINTQKEDGRNEMNQINHLLCIEHSPSTVAKHCVDNRLTLK